MTNRRRLRLRFTCPQTFDVSADDVALLLEFLEAPAPFRRDAATRLQRLLQALSAVATGGDVPCQRALGLFVGLSWPAAAWLAEALQLPDDELHELHDRLANWLAGESQTTCRATSPGRIDGRRHT